MLLCVLLAAAGCGGPGRGPRGAETDDPLYRRGQQLLKQGRNQEALDAFLRVIDERGGDAPESHLSAGLIYQQYPPKDPVAAIYHFRRYLEAQPNSREADLVRGRIDAAMREFARSLPAQPLENRTARFELMDKIDQLQKENEQLKEEMTLLRKGRGGAMGGQETGGPTGVAANSPPPVMRLAPIRAPAPGPAVSPATPTRSPAGAPTSVTPPRSGRTHVVAAGETLYRIAQRYYGNGARWPEILEANRDQLKNANSVRPGMELRIP